MSIVSKESSNVNLVLAVAAAVPAALLLKRLLFADDKREETALPYPPGPKQHFLLGNILDPPPDFEKGESYDTINLAKTKEHGLIFSIYIPFFLGRIIIVGDPELAKKVLVTENYPKPHFFYKLLKPMLGDRSLVTLQGQEWAGMRRAFNPGFAPTFLKDMAKTMAVKLERMIQKIDQDVDDSSVTNMLLEAQSFTSDVIVQIAFGEDWGNSEEPHPARRLEDEIARLYSVLIKSVIRRAFDWKTHRRMNQVGAELNQEMAAILERRLKAGADASSNAKDILSLAIFHIAQEKPKGAPFTDDDKAFIVDQLKTFYFAGHDTTATTIAWAMWELSKNPDALATLRAELQEQGIWQGNDFSASNAPSYEQLQKCTYLEGVVKESLRLYPPASGLSRQCENDYESYKGMRIGGAIMIVSAYIIHRHPDLWKDPNEFRPQRFSDGSEGDINAKFLPFSKGKRDCIGKYFALLEAKLAVSALAMRYDLECDDPTDFMEQVLTNLPASGAKVKFTKKAVSPQ